MTEEERRLSPEEAGRLWRRAAELQTEAAGRLEGEPRERAPFVDGEIDAGYALDDVREAASAVGIAPEFVDLALAEGSDAEESRSARSRLARWFAGPGSRSLVVSRRFQHPSTVVQNAVLAVFPRYHLTLVEMRKAASGGGASLTFALSMSQSDNIDFMRDLYWHAGVREVQVRLEPRGEHACLAVLSAPSGKSPESNFVVGATGTAAGGVVGAWGLGALGALVTIQLGFAGILAGASIGVAMLLGVGTGGGVGLKVTRGAYQAARRRGVIALERLLQLVGIDLQVGRTSGDPKTERSLPSG